MDKMIELLEMRKKILFLMMKNDWDFAVINFKTMDDVLHMFWHFNDVSHPQYDKKLVKKYGNLLLEYHKHVDKILKQILRKIDKNTTLFVISDHGMKSKFREKNIKGKLIRFISILTKQTKKNHIMANHARDGIFIAYGKNIKKTGKIDNKSLMDIAPTALNLYDIKIPEFMDGSPIKEILE
jgi:predicted AlkP superfamily phosphohydrolase/phosphomutase